MNEQIASEEERIEWRVESETLEDEFGDDEQGARDWMEHCQVNPDWEPVTLMRRVVRVEVTEWEAAS